MTAHFTHRRSWGISTRDAALAARLHDSDVYGDCSEAPPFEPIHREQFSMWKLFGAVTLSWTVLWLLYLAIVTVMEL